MRRCLVAGAVCALTACGRYSAGATVTVAVSGPGAVRASQLQGNCHGTCWFTIIREAPVHLDPVADAHAVFAGWSGACSGTGACDLKPAYDASVAANFVPATPRHLQVSLNGLGEVTSDPPGIDCPRTCGADFAEGTPVTLQPAAASGWDFTSFDGACAGQGCTIQVSADSVASATFTQRPVTLTIHLEGSGSVVSTPAAIDCPRICSATFAPDAVVTLAASAPPGFNFGGFSGGCAGRDCSLRLTAPVQVSAVFSTVPLFKLVVALSGDGVGRISSTPPGIDCPGTCTATFLEGTAVALAATADALSKFVRYDGPCTGGTCGLTLKSDVAIGARFDQRRYQVVDLGMPAGGGWSLASGISPHGTLVAGLWGGSQQVFFWDGSMHDAGVAQGNSTGVNDAGLLVGNASTPAGWRAFRWQNGVATALEPSGAPESYATAVDRDGVVAGWERRMDGQMRATLWTAKGAVDLGPGGTVACSAAWGINSEGVAVGEVCTVAGGVRGARFRAPGVIDDLGSLGGYTRAEAINDKGVIVGFSFLPGGAAHGFVYADGKLIDAGTLPGKSDSDLVALNSQGIAVGSASGPGGASKKAVVYGSFRMVDLNQVTDGTPYVMNAAAGIDEAGNIVVDASLAGIQRALLLRPQ